MKKLLLLAILTAFLVISAGVAVAGERVIVVFKEGTTAVQQDNIVMLNGGEVIKHLGIINAVAVKLPDKASDKAKRAMISDKSVVTVEEDAIVRAWEPQEAEAPARGVDALLCAFVQAANLYVGETLPWGVDRIDADLAWGTSTGLGVKVAVLDTGIDLTHPDLAANIKGGYNAISRRRSPNDDNGHGTHCAGTIAAIDNEIGVIGVAPQAYLYAVKVLDMYGYGWTSDLVESINWCVKNKMQVASMSLGFDTSVMYLKSLHRAVKKAYSAGVVLVAASGNHDPYYPNPGVGQPATYPEVIAVSATDDSDNLASFSNYGPEVDLAAPGVDIVSTYIGGLYAIGSGTSMACPHVSGTVALMIAAGRWSYGNLYSAADDLGPFGKDDMYGWGLVDAEEATTGTQTSP
jgi:subtilisin family serine protease